MGASASTLYAQGGSWGLRFVPNCDLMEQVRYSSTYTSLHNTHLMSYNNSHDASRDRRFQGQHRFLPLQYCSCAVWLIRLGGYQGLSVVTPTIVGVSISGWSGKHRKRELYKTCTPEWQRVHVYCLLCIVSFGGIHFMGQSRKKLCAVSTSESIHEPRKYVSARCCVGCV